MFDIYFYYSALPIFENLFNQVRELRLARYGFWLRDDSGFRVYAGAFYAALNPKPNTNHSLGVTLKSERCACQVAPRHARRASRSEKNLPDLKNAENLARTS